MPNPTVPFSFLTVTAYTESPCLPVYYANDAATDETIQRYGDAFGRERFLELLKLLILGHPFERVTRSLSERSLALVRLLANSKTRNDGLTADQWKAAYKAVSKGISLPDFLAANVRLPWKKKAYIAALTDTARRFMDLGATDSLGLSSSALPLSFVPRDKRPAFSARARELYPDMPAELAALLADDNVHLVIAWVMGFKPRGDDARPDRGLAPLARMLVGNDCDLLAFIYGPAPRAHWHLLASDPLRLSASNGLWQAVLAVSDAVLVDSATKPDDTPRAYLKRAWAPPPQPPNIPLRVEPRVSSLSEHDVDTALHVCITSLGPAVAFEGLCNPPAATGPACPSDGVPPTRNTDG